MHPSTPCTGHLPASNEVDKRCIPTDLHLKQMSSRSEFPRPSDISRNVSSIDRSRLTYSTFARAAIVVTLLTAVIGLEEPFWAFRMALAGCQLPPARTSDALIPPWSRTGFARQVTLGALTSVAIIPEIKRHPHKKKNIYMYKHRCRLILLLSVTTTRKHPVFLPLRARRSAFSALQLQSVLAGGAVQAGDAALASVQARHANRPRRLHHRVITVVALGHTAFALEERRVRARYAVIFRRTGAGLAGRVARLALAVLIVLAGVAVAAILRRAQTLLVQTPALDAAGAAQSSTGRATGRARHALSSLFVGAIASWARRLTRVCDIRMHRGACIDTSCITQTFA